MDILEIKNMHSNEIRELKEALVAELRFRENIGKEIELSRENNGRHHVASIIDEQLRSAFRLKESLTEELGRAEIMSDRIPVRKDLREINSKISKLTAEIKYENELHGPGPDEER